MNNLSAWSSDGVERVVQTYGNALFRLCLVMLRSEADAEDAVQDTMIKYLQNAPIFENSEHEKAWLIKVATNKCRDMLRFKARHPQIEYDSLQDVLIDVSDSGILEALMTLPEKFRLVLVLYYVEEYRIDEIAQMIGRTPSTVKMRLQKGRRMLEQKYRKEYM